MLERTRDRRSRLREGRPKGEIARIPSTFASPRHVRFWSRKPAPAHVPAQVYSGSMSTLERRLHVLIDQERHAQLTEESKRTGRSVGDIVRSAIDLHFDEERDRARRAAAARFLLATADTGDGPGETWDEMLDARARDIEEMLET